MGNSPCKFMHDLYIAETYRPRAICLLQYGSTFIRLYTVNFGKRLWQSYCKVVCYSCSRSFKVTNTGTTESLYAIYFLL